MDQQGHPGPTGPAGRRLHIAHRRSPSELTPLMSTSDLSLSILQFNADYIIGCLDADESFP